MLYGFLGFRPTVDGFSINPRLPKDWPELTITRIHLHNQVLDVTVTTDGGLKIRGTGDPAEELVVTALESIRLLSVEGVKAQIVKPQRHKQPSGHSTTTF